MADVSQIAEEIVSKFTSKGYNVDRKGVEKRLDLLLNEFKVSEIEARRTIENFLMKELGIEREALYEKVEAKEVKISEIETAGLWVTLKAKVLRLWDSNSDKIQQSGVIGDETGTIRVVVWTSGGEFPTLEEGKSYLFKNVITRIYNDRFQISVTKGSEIHELDEDIQAVSDGITFEGVIVSIHKNSGLVQRCTECGRIATKSVCPQHGKCEVADDLVVRGFIDNGEKVYGFSLSKELVERITGITIEDAIEIAQRELDREAVLSEIKKRLLGRYVNIKGSIGENYIFVDEIEFVKVDRDVVEELVKEVV